MRVRVKTWSETLQARPAARRRSHFGGTLRLFDEFQFVGYLGGFVGFFPLGGGCEFGGRCGLALFQKSVGAENDAVGIPEPNEAESANGFELEEAVAEGVYFLFVLWQSMITGMVEELGELGEFVGLEVCGVGEKVF